MRFNIAFIHRHLHLELHKISREVNSIFEIEMTFKMVCYFGFIAEFFRELFTAIFVRDYSTSERIMFVTIIILWLAWYIFRILLINYICERVSAKVLILHSNSKHTVEFFFQTILYFNSF